MVSTRESIGFIGLGQMGMGMARNLLAAGYDVLAYDVATPPLERFVGGGADAKRPIRPRLGQMPARPGHGGEWGTGGGGRAGRARAAEDDDARHHSGL